MCVKNDPEPAFTIACAVYIGVENVLPVLMSFALWGDVTVSLSIAGHDTFISIR